MSEYQNIISQLNSFQDEELGQVLKFGEVYGFRTKPEQEPVALLTACHHANEVFSTYETVLEFLKCTDLPVIGIPVVDVEGFEKNIECFNEFMARHQSPEREFLLKDCLRKGGRPLPHKRDCWSYGKPDSAFPFIESLINKVDAVIDLHNNFSQKYFFVIADEQTHDLARILDQNQLPVACGFAGNLRYLGNGFYKSLDDNSILEYCQQKNKKAIAFEIPVFYYKNSQVHIHKELVHVNIALIDYYMQDIQKF